MTEREAKNLLKDWGQSLELCEKKQEEINELTALIQDNSYIGSPKNDGMPKGNTKTNVAENTAIKLIEVYVEGIEKLTEDIKDILEKKGKLDKIINKFDFEHQRIIKLRYYEDFSWTYISKALHISRNRCFKIHRDVLEMIMKLWLIWY